MFFCGCFYLHSYDVKFTCIANADDISIEFPFVCRQTLKYMKKNRQMWVCCMSKIWRHKNRMNFHVLITHILIHYTGTVTHSVLVFVSFCIVYSLLFWFCLARGDSSVVSELLWYVVWRWFYVHTIDYAKQFMFCVWIGNNDANWFDANAVQIFLFTLITFDVALTMTFYFQIISIKMTNETKPPHS